MDKNRIIGAGKQVSGTIKETAGKLTGNDRLEAEGKVETAVGKGQAELGAMTDKVHDAVKDADKKAEHAAADVKAKLDSAKT